jgi:hypothetical protein
MSDTNRAKRVAADLFDAIETYVKRVHDSIIGHVQQTDERRQA